MKKIIVIILFCVCLCGCSKNWKSNVQISSLKYDDDYIIGKMKNLTNKAYNVKIIFKTKSGSFDDNEYCYELLRPKETIDLECLVYGLDDTYNIEVENVELEEFEIPELTYGKIDIDTLEYHFKDIYYAHTLNFVSFKIDIDNNYPYIDEIEYSDDKIEIKGTIENDENQVFYYEDFDAKDEQLTHLYAFIKSDDEDFISKIITKFSLMDSISSTSSDSISIGQILKRKDIAEGYCIKAGNWCIGTDYSESPGFKVFTFDRR